MFEAPFLSRDVLESAIFACLCEPFLSAAKQKASRRKPIACKIHSSERHCPDVVVGVILPCSVVGACAFVHEEAEILSACGARQILRHHSCVAVRTLEVGNIDGKFFESVFAVVVQRGYVHLRVVSSAAVQRYSAVDILWSSCSLSSRRGRASIGIRP